MTNRWGAPRGGDGLADRGGIGTAGNPPGRLAAAPRAGEAAIRPPAATGDIPPGGDDDEWRRLEESIRWLRKAGAEGRLPASAQAAGRPAASGIPPVLSQNPATFFAPETRPRRTGKVVAAVSAAALVFFAVGRMLGPAAPQRPALPTAALSGMTPAAEDHAGQPPAGQPAAIAGDPRPAAAAPPDGRGDADEPAEPGDGSPPVAGAAPANGPASEPPAPQPAGDTAMLLGHGRTLFETGDVAGARLLFRRAADAGDAAAAAALGATYDPVVLAQRFTRGIDPDPQEAERWYALARALGAPVAAGEQQYSAHR